MADRIVVMNHGVIEQVGTPLEIYREPATAFVADFIGTMNFVPGTIAGPERLRLGGLELACATNGGTQGAPVTVAVRPEDIVVLDISGGDHNAFPVRVGEMEFLGSFYRALLRSEAMGEQALRADLSINLVRRLDINQGDEIIVAVPPDCIRVYPGARH